MGETDDGRWKSLGVASLAAMWAVALYGVLTLPPSIVTRWHANGDASYGSKWSLLFLPVVVSIAFAILRVARNARNIRVNVPFTIPEERRDAAVAVARHYLDVTAAALAFGFACMEAAIVRASATGRADWTFYASIVLLVVLIFSTVAKMLADIYRASRA